MPNQKNHSKKAYLKNRRVVIERSKAWAQKNPEKVKKRRLLEQRQVFKLLARYANKRCGGVHRLTPLDLFSIARKQKLKCALTGDKLTRTNVSVDHIVPRSKGGINVPTNVRLVTYDVNMSKHNHTDEEFVSLCKKVVATLEN